MLSKINFLFFSLFLLSFYKIQGETLSFDQAATKTLSLSPILHIANSEISEASGARVQSSLYPNPAIGYSVENVFGNKEWQGWDAAESRYEIGQLIELGGKRSFRMQVAKFQYYAAQAGFEVKQLALLNRLLKLFIAVAATQEILSITAEQTQLAEEVYKTVAAKVEAGKVSLIQQNKAEIALSTAQINFDKAKSELLKSKQRLALLWADESPDFESVLFPFYEIDRPLPFENCLCQLKNNPQLLKSQMDFRMAQQNLHLEKALAVPDLTVTLGYKTIQDTKNKGMILGASIPIPLFNRNQGNIQKARAQIIKAQEHYLEIQLALENKISLSYKDLVQSYNEAEKIQSTILKLANYSFELAQEGYKEGKFEYLDMLDSQKTLFEVKERYIQALLNYHQSRADMDYLNLLEEDL